jgi:hypothetical protein
MKLSDIFEFAGVPVVGPDASRPTPAGTLQHYGVTNAQFPHQFAKDRVWAEKKEKKKKKRRQLKDLEHGIDNATPQPF